MKFTNVVPTFSQYKMFRIILWKGIPLQSILVLENIPSKSKPLSPQGNVFMYYGLTNYYQNHRRYVKSRDDEQLLGRLSLKPSSDCDPFTYNADKGNMPIAPCGAIANSLFNGKTLTKISCRNKDSKNPSRYILSEKCKIQRCDFVEYRNRLAIR